MLIFTPLLHTHWSHVGLCEAILKICDQPQTRACEFHINFDKVCVHLPTETMKNALRFDGKRTRTAVNGKRSLQIFKRRN